MIDGAHILVFSSDPEADREFVRDVLGFNYVDAGEGRLFFALPRSELAFNEFEHNDVHELYLMTDDVHAEVARLGRAGVVCTEAQDHGWGIVTRIALPGGGKLGLYQPRHARP